MTEQQTCDQCAAVIPSGSEFILEGKGDKLDSSFCSTCASAMEQSLEEETENINVINAAFFGCGAAIISALIWYGVVVVTKYELGLIAIAVGWIITRAVMWGAGHKRGPIVQMISVFFVVLAMGFSEYLILRFFFLESLNPEIAKQIPLFLPIADMADIIFRYIKSDPVALIFWIVAILEGILLPAKGKLLFKTPHTTQE